MTVHSETRERKILAQSVKSVPVETGDAQHFVDQVGSDMVSAMAAADNAVISTARTIATFVEERRNRRMPLALGLDALDLAAEAMASSIKARRDTARLELEMFRLPPQIGVTAWGPWCPCEKPV
jgi:hypothetical protein